LNNPCTNPAASDRVKDSTPGLFPAQAQDFHKSLLGLQGASAEMEAQRLREEVEQEQLNVKAALQALEAERARMAARAAAEKKRLLEKVRTATQSTRPSMMPPLNAFAQGPPVLLALSGSDSASHALLSALAVT